MLTLNIITPEKILFSADIEMVTVPGTEGDFGVLEGHAPFISTLRPGIITVDAGNGDHRKFAVAAGIAEVVPEHCTILAENAVDCASLTAADVQSRIEAARDAVELAATDSARKEAAKKLALAETLSLAV